MTFAKKDQRQVFMPKSQTANVNRAYYILIILRAYLKCPARRIFHKVMFTYRGHTL
jgi:hypothetical protein